MLVSDCPQVVLKHAREQQQHPAALPPLQFRGFRTALRRAFPDLRYFSLRGDEGGVAPIVNRTSR